MQGYNPAYDHYYVNGKVGTISMMSAREVGTICSLDILAFQSSHGYESHYEIISQITIYSLSYIDFNLTF